MASVRCGSSSLSSRSTLFGSPAAVTRIARFSLDVSNVHCLIVATLIFSILLSFFRSFVLSHRKASTFWFFNYSEKKLVLVSSFSFSFFSHDIITKEGFFKDLFAERFDRGMGLQPIINKRNR